MDIHVLVRNVGGIKTVIDVYENIKEVNVVRDNLNKLADEYGNLVDDKMERERDALVDQIHNLLEKISEAGDETVHRPPFNDWITYHVITKILK